MARWCARRSRTAWRRACGSSPVSACSRSDAPAATLARVVWHQREIRLRPQSRGFHLITREVAEAVPELREVRIGLAHLHILHTSASLTLNENASPDVRRDFETWADAAVPEDFAWTHTDEGADDMPAHVKASLMGPSLTLPVADGRL